jgi:5-methyltetrahydrofolate--homocysteine methyltransferase
VAVVSNLLNENQKNNVLDQAKKEYSNLRDQFLHKQSQKNLIPYEEAVVLKEYLDWKNYQPVKPCG